MYGVMSPLLSTFLYDSHQIPHQHWSAPIKQPVNIVLTECHVITACVRQAICDCMKLSSPITHGDFNTNAKLNKHILLL